MIDIVGKPPADQVGAITEWALHELAIAKYREDVAAGRPHGRGIVVPLTAQQRVQRALYLAGRAELDALDGYVRAERAPRNCPSIYYLLKDHNGGKDPTAPDPADRWSDKGSTFVNRTCDCIGGAAWIGGWDRFQPTRFAHLYGGWINTDSMRMDAGGPAKCFARLTAPEPGCYVVCASGSPGHAIGHIGTVVGVPAGWDRTSRASWEALEVVDVAMHTPRPANQTTTARGWFGTDAWFVVPTMQP